MNLKISELEKISKGIAHQKRILILEQLDRKSDQSIFDISENLNADFRTISHHAKKMTDAGLIKKKHDGSFVNHKLTKRGKAILMFLRTLE